MVQPSSEIRKHAVQTACVLGTNMVRLPQVALPLGRLLGEDVAAVGMTALVLAAGGLAKTLRSPAVGFDLRHCNVLFDLLTGRAEAFASLSIHALAGVMVVPKG